MPNEDVHSTCEECGASIYKAHLESGIARYCGGKLLCSHCAAEFNDDAEADVAPIELEGFDDPEDSQAAMSSTRIHGATAATLGAGGAWDDSKFARGLRPESSGGTRCRIFHCRLSDGAIQFMNDQINDWIDSNDEVVVKFATASIGLFEGKHTEPNMIMSLFY